jgi:hypothetical protein
VELIEIEIQSIKPVLMNNPAGMQAPSDKLGRKNIPTAEVEAERSVYRSATGQLFLPSEAFRGCLVSAAKGRRIGKTAATSVIKGAVFAADEQTLLILNGEPVKEYEIDTRRAVVQRNGVTRSRAKVPEWAATVRFEVDTDFIPEKQVRELLEIGGRTVGVGDYRPEKSGPFGRFKVLP